MSHNEIIQWVKIDNEEIYFYKYVFDNFYDDTFDFNKVCKKLIINVDTYSCGCNYCISCECGSNHGNYCNHCSDYLYIIPKGKYHFIYKFNNQLLVEIELYSNNIFKSRLVLNREELDKDILKSISYIEKDIFNSDSEDSEDDNDLFHNRRYLFYDLDFIHFLIKKFFENIINSTYIE